MTEVERPSPAVLAELSALVAKLAAAAESTGVAPYEELLPTILALAGQCSATAQMTALFEAVRSFDEKHGTGAFATKILPSMAASAADFYKLFPEPITALVSHSGQRQVLARFTKRQCHCILSNAFLCTFPRRSNDCVSLDGRMPSINYDEMHCVAHAQVETAKLLMTLDYFDEMADRLARNTPCLDDAAHALVIVRNNAETIPEGAMAMPLGRVVMHGLGESIEDQKEMLRVDFANAVIGGASLSFGCVQEEIMFSICPEMNVARLVCPPMGEVEAILLLRAEQFSEVLPGTYAFTLQHGQPHIHGNAQSSTVTCIDALDYRSASRRIQYRPDMVERELRKCLAGFDIQPIPGVVDAVPTDLATGNWGCGAFRGDVTLKIVVQWLACSMVGKTMHYFPFDNKTVLAFAPIADAMVAKGVKVAQLYTWLMSGALQPQDIFEQLVAEFKLGVAAVGDV